MLSKLNQTYLEKSLSKPSKNPKTPASKISKSPFLRPIKKIVPTIPPNLFSQEQKLRQVQTQRLSKTKSPSKTINNYH